MKLNDRDASILTHMISYCQQIEETITRFGNQYDAFSSDPIYRNAAALCVLQLGELAGKLSDDLKSAYDNVPWKQIRAMRNIVAHAYGTVDAEVTWEVITEDIPKLKKNCQEILNENNELH